MSDRERLPRPLELFFDFHQAINCLKQQFASTLEHRNNNQGAFALEDERGPGVLSAPESISHVVLCGLLSRLVGRRQPALHVPYLYRV